MVSTNVFNINQVSSPLLVVQLVNCFYSTLLLKKLSGFEITPEVEAGVWLEVWKNVEKIGGMLK